jgi:hypothetical protein
MSLTNAPKFWLLLVTIIGLILLMAMHVMTVQDASPFMALIIGYLVGNGVAAKKGDPVDPVIGSDQIYPKDRSNG